MEDLQTTNKNEVTEENFYDWGYTGYANLTKDEIKIPYLKIAQSSTQARSKHSPHYMEGLEEGDFFIKSKKLIFGTTIEKIVFLGRYFSYMETAKPKDTNVKALYTASQFSNMKGYNFEMEGFLYKNPSNGNYIQQVGNFLCFLPEFPEIGPVVYGFMGGNFTNYRNIIHITKEEKIVNPNTKEEMDARIFDYSWSIESKPQTDGTNHWHAIGEKDVVFMKKQAPVTDLECFKRSLIPILSDLDTWLNTAANKTNVEDVTEDEKEVF